MSDSAFPSSARQTTLRTVFAAMLGQGPVSRAELARLTGLSKQTLSEVARALEDAGWIRPCGTTQGPPGRRAAIYRLEPSRAYVLGVDLGGTKVHAAIADLDGTIVGECTQATDARGGRHVTQQIADLARTIADDTAIDFSRLHTGVIGSPGVAQATSGAILFAPNIPGLDSFDVAGELAARLGFPVTIENDVNLAALGERSRPGRQDAGNLAFIALGTGIGMGIVANGQVLRGARGGAGEIAYLPLGGDPFDSRGHLLGTLETAIGSAAILERYRGHGGKNARDVRGIFVRLGEGCDAASATLDEVARLLVQAIMAVRAVLDPEIVVLGGSIGARPELVARVRPLALRYIGQHPPIEASLCGSRATLVGAISAAVAQLQRTLFEGPSL